MRTLRILSKPARNSLLPGPRKRRPFAAKSVPRLQSLRETDPAE